MIPNRKPDDDHWVLLVDDDEDVRDVLADALREEGYLVREAAGGEEALAILRTSQPSVVITDLFMPGLDGGTLREAARLFMRVLPPFVFVTGANMTLRASMEGTVMSKPLNLDELLEVVARFCSDVATSS